jgi:hypothetical protein
MQINTKVFISKKQKFNLKYDTMKNLKINLVCVLFFMLSSIAFQTALSRGIDVKNVNLNYIAVCVGISKSF